MHSFLPLAAMGTNVCYGLACLDISPCNQMMVQVHVEKEWTPQLPIAENKPSGFETRFCRPIGIYGSKVCP